MNQIDKKPFIWVEAYRPQTIEECILPESTKKTFDMIENPLSYILIRPNIINEYGLREMREHIERTNKTDLSVFDPHKSNETGGKEWIVNKDVRDTQHVEAGPIFPKIVDLLKDTVREVINPFYGIEILESEIPQILSYGIGGHYCPHIDGESL